MAAVERDVHGVAAGSFEARLLEVDDKIAANGDGIGRHGDFEGEFQRLEDVFAVFVHEGDPDSVFSGFHAGKDDPQDDGATRVDGREFSGEDSIEGAEEVEFPLIIGCGIAQDGNLNIHAVRFSRLFEMGVIKSSCAERDEVVKSF